MATTLKDFEMEGESNCCGAKIYQPDICASCGEHCAPDTEKPSREEFNRNELAKAYANEVSWANSYLLDCKAELDKTSKVICPDLDIIKQYPWANLKEKIINAKNKKQVDRAKQMFRLEVEELAEKIYGN